jgi:FAD/FMN-containing dehydrogenase
MAKTWKNWAGNQSARPMSITSPRSVEAVADKVLQARLRQETVKCVGSGHSFTAAAVTQGHLLTLENLTGIISIDRARHVEKVWLCQILAISHTKPSQVQSPPQRMALVSR